MLASGFTLTTSDSKTRPNNATPYVAGQVVSEDTAAGTPWVFSSCTRGGGGTIGQVIITDSVVGSPTPQFALHLFSAAPSVVNDAATFAPTAADLLLFVTTISLFTWTGFSANGILGAFEISRPFFCAPESTTLYGVLIAQNAYTPAALEVFNITLGINDG